MSSTTRRGSEKHDCRELLEDLLRHLDGELTAAKGRMLERHLADCDCCGALAERTRATIALCQANGQAPLPPSVRARARRRALRLLAELGEEASAAVARASTRRSSRTRS